MSSINNLNDLYVENLKDLYSANNQAAKATQELANAAHNSELVEALKAGVEGIERGNVTITQLCEARGEKPTGETCKGMAGLVKEARAHGIDAEYGDKDAQDAMIIAQYQRMVHYGIAGYGTAQAFANRLGYTECASHLETCLSDTYDGDRHMTDIATGKTGVNAMAVN